MARRRTIDRLGQRSEFDEEGEKRDDEDETEDEEEDEEEKDAEAEADEEAVDDEEEVAPKPKKPKKKATTPKRTRAAKVVRMKAVWVVFDNSSKQIETFPYNQKAEAERFLAEKNTDKKGYYLQMLKVKLDEE